MGQAIGAGNGKSVNVDLNIIPFIDLLSCITAFLMVTAVWVNLARVDVRPTGRAAAGDPCLDGDCDAPKLSVLVAGDQIWVGVSRVNDFERIARTGASYDWPALEAALRRHKASALFDQKTAIEIAADSTANSPVPYQAVIATMDTAVRAGFVDVGLTDPAGLSARPSAL